MTERDIHTELTEALWALEDAGIDVVSYWALIVGRGWFSIQVAPGQATWAADVLGFDDRYETFGDVNNPTEAIYRGNDYVYGGVNRG